MLHCIIHRPNRRFHITDEDFLDTSETPDHAAALRIFEWKTDALIEEFAKLYDLPEGHLPSDDYLWIDEFEVAAQQLVYLSLGTRGRTTFTDTVPELVGAGSLRERYIARRGKYARPARAYGPLCYDLTGRAFLVVQNYAGDYQDEDGAWHNAFEDGYTYILKQYLCCFDVVNAAIAGLEGRKVKVVPRYDPKQEVVSQEEAHRNNVSHASDTTGVDTSTSTISGGNLHSVPVEASTKEDTIDGVGTSMVTAKFKSSSSKVQVQQAPWTVETLLALASAVLPVPDRARCDADIWDKEWLRPAQLLLAATESLAPHLAWERIDLSIRYMVDDMSPSWWRTGRKKLTPTTLRHVEAHYPQYYDEYKKSPWHPATTTPYDGPPLQYVQGYTGITQETDGSPAPIVEEAPPVAPPQGMKRRTAERLCDRIWQEYPALLLSFLPVPDERWYVSIQLGEDQWHDLTSSADWYQPTEATQASLDQALRFASERNAIPTEVGVIEPPPIVLEPQDNDVAPSENEEPYLSIEELGEELRGLRPLGSSPPMVEVAPVVEKSLPLPVQNETYNLTSLSQGKQGMSLVLATSLLDYLISAKQLNAELYPLAADRAGLRIETDAGWVLVEDAEAWRQYLATSSSPPGNSAASVIAMSGMTQAMEVAQ